VVEWIVSDTPVDYAEATAIMEARADAIAAGTADEAIWLLEHPPLYTAGTSARPEDLTDPHRFPVHQARRGGQYTYHGPGQRVVYVMLDVSRRGRDVRCFVRDLEAWVIAALAEFGVRGEIREGRVGVWVARPDKPPLPDGTRARTRSPPSASGCAAGCRSTGCRSTSIPTCRTSTASCPAASAATASPASWTWACR
jgi:lipoyl(octanoyl) transferase